MGEVGYGPMTENAHKHAPEGTPHNPGPTSYQEKNQGQRKLMQDPRFLKKLVKAICRYFILKPEFRRLLKFERAVELVQCISEERIPMRKEIVALILTLRPVADVMDTNQTERTCHSNEHT